MKICRLHSSKHKLSPSSHIAPELAVISRHNALVQGELPQYVGLPPLGRGGQGETPGYAPLLTTLTQMRAELDNSVAQFSVSYLWWPKEHPQDAASPEVAVEADLRPSQFVNTTS